MFGPHLIIDGTRCDTRKLADRIVVEQVMNDYPAAIGMTKIGGPYMFEYQAPDPAYSGVSGIVVIAESHIAIHTFPELDYFTMDIFSCKNFDHELAIEYIKNAFDVKEMDRMLVQRGLSFKGPHHGKLGATDELIAAAQARIAAGIISKEPALPDDLPGVAGGREAALARLNRTETHDEPSMANESAHTAGKMLWPQYGVTPDYGTYSADRLVVPLTYTEGAPLAANGAPLSATEAIQVNPTASISGLLDKLTTTGAQGRALGQALAAWERMARDPQQTIALALSQPVIAEGLREMLVYAVEHRYVDVIVVSAADLFADLYESLGADHFIAEDGAPIMSAPGRERASDFIGDFLDALEAGVSPSSATFWRLLGASLPTRAPRKGLLQAAANAGVTIIASDVSVSPFGAALLTARARGKTVAFDPSEDVLTLARALAQQARLGIVRVGEGPADALLTQAYDVAGALGLSAPMRTESVTLGARHPLAVAEHHIALSADATLALPLLLTGLAQRIPGTRRVLRSAHSEQRTLREAEAAIA